jgi:D-alanyl-D-alanine carboxypeptidase
MNTIAVISMLIFFPLNSLLVFNGEWVQGREFKFEQQENVAQDVGNEAVQGVEIAKVDKKEVLPIFPVSGYQPYRKDGIPDLAVPTAHSSLIIDADSGTILHYSNGKERRQIASLTKMMTAVLVMENIKDLNVPVTIGDEVYIEGTKIGCPRSGYCISQRLKVGEKISAESLLKAMLMNSANDAATALGKHIGGGSEEKFVDMMNEKAKNMGLSDTHFCTPSGLEIDGRESECYSSAYDIARITAYALRFDKIWNIARLPSNTEVASIDGTLTHTILNTDIILDQVPNCLGAKTGFTPLAGHSLLMVVADPTKKHRIVSVLLDDPYRWQDIRTMNDWAFGSYEWR